MEHKDSSQQEIDLAIQKAKEAFITYRSTPGKKKAIFLREIASEMEAAKSEIVKSAMDDTHLPEPRIAGEFARTVGQLRMFADLVEEGSWVEARVDTAIPDRQPVPKPDIRKMMVPIGPVVVFGASNFPLAYSTAGGDTASALAAGCPVLLKAHPAHEHTSKLVADCVDRAIKSSGMPEGVFAHLFGKGFQLGQQLVHHPVVKAVGFTGSYAGGKALYDLAQKRAEPIPVFSEMGSINPVFILPGAMRKRPQEVATQYAASITLSVGQFCTNPGLLLVSQSEGVEQFQNHLATLIKEQVSGKMLHPGISTAYSSKRKEALEQKGVTLLAESMTNTGDGNGQPTLATVGIEDFMSNPKLIEEVFGPYSLLVKGESVGQLSEVLDSIPGQLTATIIGDDEDFVTFADFIGMIREKAGRIIINGVPTGVEVCPSMQHGGPFPSTSDSRFTSVGTDAIKRFVRPVSFQNFPQLLLPEELRDDNPLSIWRLVNSKWVR